MKALHLSTENQVLLVKLLEKLFGSYYKRIEVENTLGGVVVLFSTVGKFHITNFLASRSVNSQIPLLELFMREIPEALSQYGAGNKTWTPIFVLKFSMMGRSTGDNLVAFLNETLNGMKDPIDPNDYNFIKDQADRLGRPEKEEELLSVLKNTFGTLHTDTCFMDLFMHKD